MPKNKYKNNVGNKNIKGGTLIPFHKEGNTTYFRVLANDPFKTDSVLVGPNNKNGIALDNNEIVKETKNHIEVASDDLGTTKVIESLSSKMPLPDAFRQGYIRQELYKDVNNINNNNNKFVEGGEPSIINNKNYNENKADLYYDYLRINGLNHEQTVGILGNMSVESYLKADKKQNKGPAYGLMQWEGIRKNKVKTYKGNPYLFGSKLSAEEQKQLDYIIKTTIGDFDKDEWKATGKKFTGKTASRDAQKAFKNTKNVEEATTLLLDNYERPRVPVKDKRLNMANYYDEKYKNNLPNTLDKYNNLLTNNLDIDKYKKTNYQSRFFKGGRTRMVNGGDKEIKPDIKPAVVIAEKPNTRDKFYIHKRKVGNKIYYDVDGKLIDNEANAYKYATSIMKARGTIDMSDTLDTSNISSDKKRMPFDNIDFTIPNNDKLKDGRKWVIDSLKLSPKEKEAFIYETSSYEDRPKKNNKSKEDKDVYTVSRYEDNPFIKESTFVGPVLRKRKIDTTNATNEKLVENQVEKPTIKYTKNTQSRLRSINRNSLTNDYTLTDIAPSKEIEDITLDNTVAKRVGQEILNGNEYLSPIDVLNPIKRQVQPPLKKGVYNIGKSGPSFGDKLRLGWDKFKKFMSTPEGAFAASAATDITGNIIASGIERRAIDSTKYAPAPIQNSTSKMLTNYNINPQLASIRNEAANAQRDITENTLSSKTRQNRLNLLGLNTALNTNQLYANKENIETQLINQDSMNQQNIRNSNIDAYNKWLAAKTEFDNNKILNKAGSTVSAISGIGQALGNYASNLLQSQQFANNVDLYKALNPDAAKVVPKLKCGDRYNKKRRK